MKRIICIICLVLIGGCAWFEDKRTVVPIETKLAKIKLIDWNSKEYRNIFIMLRAKTLHPEWTIKELRAEVEYQKYLYEREKPESAF